MRGEQTVLAEIPRRERKGWNRPRLKSMEKIDLALIFQQFDHKSMDEGLLRWCGVKNQIFVMRQRLVVLARLNRIAMVEQKMTELFVTRGTFHLSAKRIELNKDEVRGDEGRPLRFTSV